MSSRTSCMPTRRALSWIVVSAPTTSYSPARRTSCSDHAESLPLDHAMRALGFGITLAPPAPQPQSGVRGALARLPRAADRAPQRLVHGLAREEQPVAYRLHQHLASGLSVHGRRR